MTYSSHGASYRPLSTDALGSLDGHGDPGKFGRMFPNLPPLAVPDAPLESLAKAMVDAAAPPIGDNPEIAAGFTYLGQFVDHDLTLDTTPLVKQDADPTATRNFRTPALDLDSLYRDGPGVDPELYGRANLPPYGPTAKLLVGMTDPVVGAGPFDAPGRFPNDLPRNPAGRAIIGDQRNDENLLVAQTHVAFLKFHNRVVDHLMETRPDLTGDDLFFEARRLVTWHYQWIVLFDFVERLTEPGLIRRIMQAGRRFYRFRERPYMPVEFAAAAYRLGHSMIRQEYSHNRIFRPGGAAPAAFDLLFVFTGKSGAILGDLVDDPAVAPHPGAPGGKLRRLPSNWIIDWRRFFDFDPDLRGDLPVGDVNRARLLDGQLVRALHALPDQAAGSVEAILAFRNLRRGVTLGLPSGQSVAAAMGVPALDPKAIAAAGPDGAEAARHGLHLQTPLWYYILKEAEILASGKRLGPVGSTIVAEVFLGIVHGDRDSFLWQRSNWVPELPARVRGTYRMTDLLEFVGDLDPIG